MTDTLARKQPAVRLTPETARTSSALTPPSSEPGAGERLWEIRVRGYTYSAHTVLHGEYGVEVQLFRDAAFLWGHRFDTRAQAEQFAAAERARLEREK